MTERVAMLFDLDGTLIHSSGDLTDAINRMLEQLGLPSARRSEVESWIGHGVEPLIHRSITKEHDGRVEDDLLQRGLALFRPAYLATDFARTVLAEGMVAVVEALRSAGYPCALVTNKPTAPTLRILDKFELGGLFQTVICGDTLSRMKPDPDQLIRALELCGTNRGWMVGDSDADSAASLAAGLPFIAVRGGYGRDADPADFPSSPILTLDSLLDLLDENNCPIELLRSPPAPIP